jgi:hypothetical protein
MHRKEEPMTDSLTLSITIGDTSFEAGGPPDLVMRALSEFEKMANGHTSEPRHRNGVEQKGAPAKRSASPADNSGDKIPFGVFMQRKFNNQADRATAIFVWAKRNGGKDMLKPGEMGTLWKKIAKKPSNPTAVCQRAEKQGWLEGVGGGAYAVTGHGEKMVDKLPQASDDG